MTDVWNTPAPRWAILPSDPPAIRRELARLAARDNPNPRST